MRIGIIIFIYTIVAALKVGAMEDLSFSTVGLDGSGHTVYSLFQDSRGGMWIGTHLGLYEYDGYRLHKAYLDNDVSNTHVNTVIQRGDSLLLGTDNGFLIYDIPSGQYMTVPSGLPSDVRALVNSDNKILIGALSGLFEYDLSDSTATDLSDQLTNNTVYSLVQTPRGIYAGTYDGLAFRSVSSGVFRPIRINGYGQGRNLFVNALRYDPLKDKLYIGTEGALLELDCKSGRSEVVAEFPGNSVKSIALDPGGEIIVGTDNGLCIIGNDGIRQYRHSVSSPASLSNNRVWSVLIDRSNNLWAGTDYDLSVAYRDSDYAVNTVASITGRDDGNRIYNIYRDCHADLWLGGDHGIIRSKADGSVDWFMPGDKNYPLSHSRVRDIFEDGVSNLWIATDGGINMFNRSTGQFENHVLQDYSDRLNTNWAYSIVEDPAHRLYVGSYLGGILIADRDSLAAFPGVRFSTADGFDASRGLPNNFIHQMVLDEKGDIWCIYFRSDSITRIETGSGSISNFSIGTAPMCLFRDDSGHIWCGFQGGVGRLTDSGTISVSYKLADASDASILAIAQVGGALWLSTSEGVYAVDMVNGASRRLPLPAAEYSAIYFDKYSGMVLLGGVDRILEVNPDIAGTDLRQEPVLLTAVSVNSIPYGPPGSLRDLTELWLKSDQNHISIEFSDLEYSRQMRQRWEYRIAGDDSWKRLPEGSNRIDMANMKYGDHILQIRPVTGSVEAPVARELHIHIATPWYLTAWAIVVYGVAICMIAIGCWLYVRIRRRMRAERNKSAKTVETLQRDLRREKQAQLKPVEIISSEDRQMATVRRLIEENIADLDLSVAMLAEKSGMGQKQLYRLIKKHTDFSPVDYIRRERMNRAAALLSQRKMTVSEVMYSVGFSSSGYFSKCFQAQWGMTPKQYMEKADNQS